MLLHRAESCRIGRTTVLPTNTTTCHAFLLLLLCFCAVSCSRYALPPIENAARLRSECAELYQHPPVPETNLVLQGTPTNGHASDLGIRTIAAANWPPSISKLHPYAVFWYDGGIQIWIHWDERSRQTVKSWKPSGYFVALDPERAVPAYQASNHFIFRKTALPGIYELSQTSLPWND